MIDRSEKETKQKSRVARYSRWLLLRRMMFSRNVFCGATRPLRPPGILSSLNDPGSWSLRLSGSRPASGYDEHVLFPSPHAQQRQPSFIDHSLLPLYLSFYLSSSFILLLRCTNAHAQQQQRGECTRSLTECHDPRIVHHCGIGRNITCRRSHIRAGTGPNENNRCGDLPYPLPNTLWYYQNVNQLSRAHSR